MDLLAVTGELEQFSVNRSVIVVIGDHKGPELR
jgi:hypothetical protein